MYTAPYCTSRWLLAVASSSISFLETARLLQTDLSSALWFLHNRRCNIPDVRVSFNTFRAAKQKWPSQGLLPGSAQRKHKTPQSGNRGKPGTMTSFPGLLTAVIITDFSAAKYYRRWRLHQQEDSAHRAKRKPRRIASHRFAPHRMAWPP